MNAFPVLNMFHNDACSRYSWHLYIYSASVSVQLYSPQRPLVDVAEVFLWLMAVGTILCASYWSAWTAREASIEQDKILKVKSFTHLYHNHLCSNNVLCFNSRIIHYPCAYRLIRYSIVQDGSDDYVNMEATQPSGVVDINTTSAVLFVVVASCFLIMLYKLMSFWFIEILVVLFCIGGVEVSKI